MVGSQNEQTKRETRVAGPMKRIAVAEVPRHEAMFTNPLRQKRPQGRSLEELLERLT